MKSVRDQFAFLSRFAGQIKSGVQKIDGTLRRRAELYVLSATGVYEATRLKVHQELGHTQMRRITHAQESCPNCKDYADAGWVDIGTLPLPTEQSQCGNRCKCTVEYR